MEFRGDDRGQSVQVGAILLFGILIVLLATIQTTVIPGQNAAVEFDHSRAVQSDMQDLRNGLLRASSGDAVPTRVKLGTTYPSRLFFVNPPPAAGRLRTVGNEESAMNVTVANGSGRVTVVSDYENAREYWAAASGAGVYNTSGIEYVPNYAQYDGAPTTVYDNSVLFNTFDNGANRTLTGQRLVQGNTIDLLALRGDLAEGGTGTETVDVETLSEQRRTVTVNSSATDPLYLNVTSRLSAEVWNDDLLGRTAVATDTGPVTVDGTEYHRISIRLDEGSYRLRAGAVGVGAVSDTVRNRSTEPAYMVVTDGYDVVSNGSDETGSITVEVRDRFNNPVTGAQVNASADGSYLQLLADGSETNTTTIRTDAEGQATVEYTGVAPTRGDAWLNVSIGNETYEESVFEDLAVPEFAVGGGDGGGLNPGTTGDLILDDASNPNGNNVDLTFNNTIGTQVNITTIRLNFYYYSGGGSGPTVANSVTADGTERATNVEIGGDYRSLSPSIVVQPNDTGTTFRLTFDRSPSSSGGNRDFFVLSLVFEVDGTQYRETYFAGL
ncbi:Ig-like domain-containing protein [Halolamina salina]|uniref:Ig-like domain-containing protein n=1 Tax=Halolamina salina TaxID=1220023 RepID=A0ABD6B9V9_9EURY